MGGTGIAGPRGKQNRPPARRSRRTSREGPTPLDRASAPLSDDTFDSVDHSAPDSARSASHAGRPAFPLVPVIEDAGGLLLGAG